MLPKVSNPSSLGNAGRVSARGPQMRKEGKDPPIANQTRQVRVPPIVVRSPGVRPRVLQQFVLLRLLVDRRRPLLQLLRRGVEVRHRRREGWHWWWRARCGLLEREGILRPETCRLSLEGLLLLLNTKTAVNSHSIKLMQERDIKRGHTGWKYCCCCCSCCCCKNACWACCWRIHSSC